MAALFDGDVDEEGSRGGYKRGRGPFPALSPSSSHATADTDSGNHDTHEERQRKQQRLSDPPAQAGPVAPPLPPVEVDVVPMEQVGQAAASIFVMPPKVAKRMKGWAIERIVDLQQWSAGTADDEEDADHAITIAHGVTSAQFIKALGDAEKLPCKFALIDGNVIIYELPSRPHGQAIMRLAAQIDSFNLNTANDALIYGTAPRLTFGQNNVLEPDLELRPDGLGVPPARADGAGNLYPTVIFEVGWSETVLSLHNLAPIYLGPTTSVQLYVAIKIYPRRPNQSFALLALLYSRANVPITTPILAISCGTTPVLHGRLPPAIRPRLTGVGFGGPACNQAGIPQYQLPLPIAAIYEGVAVPGGLPVNLNIDLFQIQRQIFR